MVTNRIPYTHDAMFYGCVIDPSKGDPVAYVPSPDELMLLHISTVRIQNRCMRIKRRPTLTRHAPRSFARLA